MNSIKSANEVSAVNATAAADDDDGDANCINSNFMLFPICSLVGCTFVGII